MFQVLGIHPQSLGEGGPPALKLLRCEEVLPPTAHFEAVLEGCVVQGEENRLQDVIQIPFKKCVEADDGALEWFDILFFRGHLAYQSDSRGFSEEIVSLAEQEVKKWKTDNSAKNAFCLYFSGFEDFALLGR